MSDDFEAFFADHYGVVERAVALAIGDRGRAEELTQEAFARAFRRWRSVSEMELPVAWLYVVALNTERKRWRRQQATPAVSTTDARFSVSITMAPGTSPALQAEMYAILNSLRFDRDTIVETVPDNASTTTMTGAPG